MSERGDHLTFGDRSRDEYFMSHQHPGAIDGSLQSEAIERKLRAFIDPDFFHAYLRKPNSPITLPACVHQKRHMDKVLRIRQSLGYVGGTDGKDEIVADFD